MPEEKQKISCDIFIYPISYNPDGSVKDVKDRNGVITSYTYDIHGRVLSKAAGGEKISYKYDNSGNQLTVTDSTGMTSRVYDELDRVTMKTVPNFGTSTFLYDTIKLDDTKNVTSETSTDPKNNVTARVYDTNGRLKKVSSDGTKCTVYGYDNNGNTDTVTYPNLIVEDYDYYDNNLLKKLTNKKANGAEISSYIYAYDNANNQIWKSDSKGITFYGYDSLNRLNKITEPGKVTEYRYDKAGNREYETVTANGSVTATIYAYNEQNRLITTEVKAGDETRTTRYNYDNNGNMTFTSGEITKKIDPSNPPTPHFGMFIPG